MTLCPHCGVEVEDTERRCPLCRVPLRAEAAPNPPNPPSSPNPPNPVEGLDAQPSGDEWPRNKEAPSREPRHDPGRDDLDPHHPTRKDLDRSGSSRDARERSGASHRVRGWVLELSTLLAATSAVVVLAIDLGFGGAISWSRYPLASIALLWVSTVLILLSSQRVWIYLPAQILAANLFLFLLDRFASGPSWFWPLALPLTLLIAVFLAAVLAIVRHYRPSVPGTMVIVMLAAGAFSVALELLLHRYLDQRWFIRWSAVVVASMVPVLGLMLYLRGWFRARRSELRKLLHM